MVREGGVEVDGEDVSGAEGVVVVAPWGRGGAEGGLEFGEEAAGGDKAGESFREGVVAVAGKVFALRCVESRGEFCLAAVGAAGGVVEVVGSAAEAVGESGGEEDRLHDVAAVGDCVEEQARAFLGAGEEACLVFIGILLLREEAMEVSKALFVLEA